MKIVLFDRNHDVCAAWNKDFQNNPGVSILNCELNDLPYHDYLVTPGNRLGTMSDGMDLAVRNMFGYGLQDFLQVEMLKVYPYGIHIGNIMTIKLPDEATFKHIIYAPTVRSLVEPIRILDIVYVMSIIVSLTLEYPEETFAIPGLGSGCGGLSATDSSKAMKAGYDAARFIRDI